MDDEATVGDAGAGMPQVSVVMPTRNRERLAVATLRTVLAQGVDLEVVVVNDGSTDDTAQRIHELGDPRVSVVEGGGNGVAAARNLGIRHARGKWIAFKDDDDRWAPDKLAKQLAALVEMDASWSICGAVTVDETVRLRNSYRPSPAADVARDVLSDSLPGGGSNVVASRELVGRAGDFDPDLQFEDWDYWIRLALLGGPPAVIDEPLVAYLSHRNSRVAECANRGAFEEIEGRYREERAAARVADDWPRWLGGLAEAHQRANDRRRAAWGHLEVAAYTHRAQYLGRAALALAWPGSIRINDLKRVRGMPDEYRASVEVWLANQRSDWHHKASGLSSAAQGRQQGA